MTKLECEEIVTIGMELGTLNAEDVAFIMDESHSESEVTRRMISARHRSSIQDLESQRALRAVPMQHLVISF